MHFLLVTVYYVINFTMQHHFYIKLGFQSPFVNCSSELLPIIRNIFRIYQGSLSVTFAFILKSPKVMKRSQDSLPLLKQLVSFSKKNFKFSGFGYRHMIKQSQLVLAIVNSEQIDSFLIVFNFWRCFQVTPCSTYIIRQPQFLFRYHLALILYLSMWNCTVGKLL